MATTQKVTLTQVSQNIEKNMSAVRIYWTTTNTGPSYNGVKKTGYCYVTVNGNPYKEFTAEKDLPKDQTKVVLDETIDVEHDANGKCVVQVKTSMDTGLAAGTIVCEETLQLTDIPKVAKIESIENAVLGQDCLVTWTPTDGYTYTLHMQDAFGWSDEAANIQPSAKPYTYPFRLLERNGSVIEPDAKSCQITATLYTYDKNGKVVGSDSMVFDAYLLEDDDSRPSVSINVLAINPDSSLTSFVKTITIPEIRATVETKYGASIGKQSITINGVPYNGGVLTQAGEVEVRCTVEDSRGFVGYGTKTINVLEYENPKILPPDGQTDIVIQRCDPNGNALDSGAYLKVQAKIVYSNLYNNLLFYQISCRDENGNEDTSDVIYTEDGTVNEVLDFGLEETKNYTVTISAWDAYGGQNENRISRISETVPSNSVYEHRPAGGKGMGLGGYNQRAGDIDIYWRIVARSGMTFATEKAYQFDSLKNGVYEIEDGVEDGVLLQFGTLSGATTQIALYTSGNPKYRNKLDNDTWGDWRTF